MKLSGNIVLKVLAIQVAVLFQYTATAILVKDLFQVTSESLDVFLVVDKEAVQFRLDEYFQENPDAPRLYIPETPPVGLNESQHLVLVTFGFASGPDVVNLSPDEGVAVYIMPHLASSPGGPSHYSLLIGDFVPEHIPGMGHVDEITVTDGIIRVSSLDEVFEATYKVSNPCVPPVPLVRHELDDDVIKSYFFNDEAIWHMGECDGERASELPEHCAKVASVIEGIQQYGANVCEVNAVTDGEKTCDAEIEITTITKGFRDLLLLGDGPITVEGVEWFNGTFSTGIKYPCIE